MDPRPLPAEAAADVAGTPPAPPARRRVALPPENAPATPVEELDSDGNPVRSDADRFAADLGAVAVITDRGITHARNDDAVSAAVVEDPATGRPLATVIVVSDGVSSSDDPQAASGAAVRAGLEATVAVLEAGGSAAEAVPAGLEAAAAAVRAVGADVENAPSCTFVSAVVHADGPDAVLITVANVGDSRAYWLRAGVAPNSAAVATQPELTIVTDGGAAHAVPSQRLTVDDSWAQALVDAGAMDEQAAMRDPRAHTLLRWLGADTSPKPWADDCVRTLRTRGPGVLLLCSDGLWNYISDPEALAAPATGAAPADAARELVEFALRCGGNDNITVALAPVAG
ncbi:PP2C family protein-serine/threonine phosphatase [Nocardia jiangsuensis]|uniref:PP2C family protein-serine/threonine phosphatase n=1 Tax=Nocardia jiangsuensis TaxID=1691563 RepID=A0ABV8DNY0_9NOCA